MAQIQRYKEQIDKSEWDDLLIKLYGRQVLESQRRRYQKSLDDFSQYFEENHQDVAILSAPGRSEMIGNHTDHQGGKVLCCAVSLDTLVIFRLSMQRQVEILSDGFDAFTIDTDSLERRADERGTSQALVRGILFCMRELGWKIGGFQAYIQSQVPQGSGLSSSASFEIAIASILNVGYNHSEVDAISLAQIAQYSENHYFGKPCGLMDQLACAHGGVISIDFKDLDQPKVERISLGKSLDDYAFVMVNSHGSHADLTQDYALITQEMHQVAEHLGVKQLAQSSMATFYDHFTILREQLGDRMVLRAHHFFQENRRVDAAKQALLREDKDHFFALVNASGQSSFSYLQNVYQGNKPESQALSIAQALSQAVMGDDGAWRIHGGGFAGTIIAFVPREQLDHFTKVMQRSFGQDAVQELSLRSQGVVHLA